MRESSTQQALGVLMDWAKLSTSYYLDEAIAQAGEAAEVLFLRCIAYSGAKESRGRVSKSILPMLAPTKTPARLAALIREGLLVDDGDHVLIRSWDTWQTSLDKESDRKRKDRERKAAERLAAAETVQGLSVDVSLDSTWTCPPEVLGPLSRDLDLDLKGSQPSSASAVDEMFETWWTIYPRREAKAAARKAFAKALKAASVEQIMGGAARYRDDPNRLLEFTPHPASWLNAERWDDDPLPQRQNGRPMALSSPSNPNKEW